jgi:flagella basal body P-ring formation protein FlgA
MLLLLGGFLLFAVLLAGYGLFVDGEPKLPPATAYPAVLVVQDIPRGELITDSHVQLVDVPSPVGVADIKLVVNAYAIHSMIPGDYVKAEDITDPEMTELVRWIKETTP